MSIIDTSNAANVLIANYNVWYVFSRNKMKIKAKIPAGFQADFALSMMRGHHRTGSNILYHASKIFNNNATMKK